MYLFINSFIFYFSYQSGYVTESENNQKTTVHKSEHKNTENDNEYICDPKMLIEGADIDPKIAIEGPDIDPSIAITPPGENTR